MNPKEKHATALFEALEGFERLVPEGELTNMVKFRVLEKEFVRVSQILLKAEWKRVKRGEIVFQIARATSFAVLLSSVAALLWLASQQ